MIKSCHNGLLKQNQLQRNCFSFIGATEKDLTRRSRRGPRTRSGATRSASAGIGTTRSSAIATTASGAASGATATRRATATLTRRASTATCASSEMRTNDEEVRLNGPIEYYCKTKTRLSLRNILGILMIIQMFMSNLLCSEIFKR